MSRNPFKPAEIHAEPGAVPESHQITLSDEAEAKDIEQEMFALAMRDVGAYQALDMVEKISGRAKAEIYIRQEKTKAYRSLTYKADDGSRKKIPDIDTFCEVFFGKTGRSIRSAVQNYHLLGPELYEASERLGFKGKDYTALKALPADDQEVIKQAMAADDRGEVLDLLQEMAARHASEKAALTAHAKEAAETAEARSEVIAKKESAINALQETNSKLLRRIQNETPDELAAVLREEVGHAAYGAEAQILGNLRQGFAALEEHAQTHGVTHENFMSGCLAQIEAALATVRAEFGVKARPDADPAPDWVKDSRSADEIVRDTLGDQLDDFNARMAANG